jgi:hypothetical protein
MEMRTQTATMKDWSRLGAEVVFTLVVLVSIGHYLAHMMVTPF